MATQTLSPGALTQLMSAPITTSVLLVCCPADPQPMWSQGSQSRQRAVWGATVPFCQSLQYLPTGGSGGQEQLGQGCHCRRQGQEGCHGKTPGQPNHNCRPHGLSGWGWAQRVGVSADSLGAASSILRGRFKED